MDSYNCTADSYKRPPPVGDNIAGDAFSPLIEDFTVAVFETVLKFFAIAIAIVAGLHVAMGTQSEILLGARWPQGVPFDATIDSQDRFYGAAFAVYACLLWVCARDLTRYAPVLKIIFAVFFFAGLARFVSFAVVGLPSPMICFLWAVEVVSPPVLWLWLARLQRQSHRA